MHIIPLIFMVGPDVVFLQLTYGKICTHCEPRKKLQTCICLNAKIFYNRVSKKNDSYTMKSIKKTDNYTEATTGTTMIGLAKGYPVVVISSMDKILWKITRNKWSISPEYWWFVSPFCCLQQCRVKSNTNIISVGCDRCDCGNLKNLWEIGN